MSSVVVVLPLVPVMATNTGAFNHLIGRQDFLQRVLVFFEGNAGVDELFLVLCLDGPSVGHEDGVAFCLRKQGRAHATFGGSQDYNEVLHRVNRRKKYVQRLA